MAELMNGGGTAAMEAIKVANGGTPQKKANGGGVTTTPLKKMNGGASTPQKNGTASPQKKANGGSEPSVQFRSCRKSKIMSNLTKHPPVDIQYDKLTYTVPDNHACGGGGGSSMNPLASLLPASMRARTYKTILKGRVSSFVTINNPFTCPTLI